MFLATFLLTTALALAEVQSAVSGRDAQSVPNNITTSVAVNASSTGLADESNNRRPKSVPSGAQDAPMPAARNDTNVVTRRTRPNASTPVSVRAVVPVARNAAESTQPAPVDPEVNKVAVKVNGELAPFCDIADALWMLDETDRFEPGRDITVNTDPRKGALLQDVNEAKFGTPLYDTFTNLLDNYDPVQTRFDRVTPEDTAEQGAFLDVMLDTKPMQLLARYLAASKHAAGASRAALREHLMQLWFTPFHRGGGKNSSSGFEHTFTGELALKGEANYEVSGFHNWIVYSRLERLGQVAFTQWKNPRVAKTLPNGHPNPHAADPTPNLASVSFTWTHGDIVAKKPLSSMYIGASPAFEIALYTLALTVGQEGSNVCDIGEYTTDVRAFKLQRGAITVSGTAFGSAQQWNGVRLEVRD